MTNSNSSSPKQFLSKIWLGYLAILIAVVGFLDASYLSSTYINKTNVGCFIAHGCDVVTTSVYAKLFGVPIAVLGMGYYFLAFGLLLTFVLTQKHFLVKWLTVLFGLAVLFSARLVYLQLAVLKEICIYCMSSAAISLILFLLTLYLYKSIPKTETLTLK